MLTESMVHSAAAGVANTWSGPLLLQPPRNVTVVGCRLSCKRVAYYQMKRWGGVGVDSRRKASRFCVKAVVGENMKKAEAEVPTSVPVRVAYELLLAGHRYLDVRTPEEFSAGHAEGAINIPYMYRIGSGMTKNPKFVEQVSSQFGKYNEIIVGCQLGKRSMMAATDLLAAGFMAVTDIAGGYAAWTQNDLPTEK